jgi:Flp pilus assembly protein TadG
MRPAFTQTKRLQRPGATAVEYAVISPLVFLLIFGLAIGGLGIFRYQQVASLAREGARYASVRGVEYSTDMKQPAATEETIYKEVILERAVGLDRNALTCKVSWNKYNTPRTVNDDGTISGNIVSVTVNYQWFPEGFLGGIMLSSTSKLPMSY